MTGGDVVAAGARTGAASGDTMEARGGGWWRRRGGGGDGQWGCRGGGLWFWRGRRDDGGADSSSSSSFSYEDSEKTVSETRPEVGLDEAGPTEVPEARPVDPFLAQFGEDDSWWWNMVNFVQQGAEGDARDPPNYWRE